MEALVAWTLALAEQQPLVMLYEDLHWSDPSTVEILGLLLGQSPTAKVLTLLSFRPSFEPPWPGRSHVTPLAVSRQNERITLVGGGISSSFSSRERARISQSARPANMEIMPRTVSFFTGWRKLNIS